MGKAEQVQTVTMYQVELETTRGKREAVFPFGCDMRLSDKDEATGRMEAYGVMVVSGHAMIEGRAVRSIHALVLTEVHVDPSKTAPRDEVRKRDIVRTPIAKLRQVAA